MIYSALCCTCTQTEKRNYAAIIMLTFLLFSHCEISVWVIQSGNMRYGRDVSCC